MGFGQEIDEMWVRLTLKDEQFKAGLAGAKGALTQWRDETNANTGEMAKWGAAIGATAAPWLAVGAVIYGAVEKYGAMAQQLKDLSYYTGLSMTKLQQLQYAATLSGTSFDRVTFSVGNLNLKIAEAEDKTSAAAKAFNELGINPAGKSPDQIFDETARALVGLTDSTTRARLANELYGRGWREVLPFMEDYIAKKKEIAAHSTISPEDLKTLSDSKAAIDSVTSSLNLMIAQLVISGEKSREWIVELHKVVSISERAKAVAESKPGFGAGGRAGEPSIPLSIKTPITEDPFKGLTAKLAEIKYLNDVIIPQLINNLQEAQKTGDMATVEKAALDLLKAKEQVTQDLIDSTKDLTDKTKGYADSLKAVSDELTTSNNLKRDYLEKMQFAGGDVSQLRALRMSYNQASRDQSGRIQAAAGKAQEAGAAMVAAGGTAGGNTWNITITASKDYPMSAVIKDLKTLSKADLMQAGVRV